MAKLWHHEHAGVLGSCPSIQLADWCLLGAYLSPFWYDKFYKGAYRRPFRDWGGHAAFESQSVESKFCGKASPFVVALATPRRHWMAEVANYASGFSLHTWWPHSQACEHRFPCTSIEPFFDISVGMYQKAQRIVVSKNVLLSWKVLEA